MYKTKKNCSLFLNLFSFVIVNDLSTEKDFSNVLCSHQENLKSKFENYLPISKDDEFLLVSNLSHCYIEINKLPSNEGEQLIELLNDTIFKIKFQAEEMVNFLSHP